MIIALQALALAMIVGGSLLAYFGWDIVLVERGWTMVIAGSVLAASGALLLGIAAAVSRLARIERRLMQLQDGFPETGLSEAHASSIAAPALGAAAGAVAAGQMVSDDIEPKGSDEAQPTLPLFEDEPRDEPEETKVTAAEWPAEEGVMADTSIVPFPPRTSPVAVHSREEDEPEMKVPDFLLVDRREDLDEEPRVVEPVLDLPEREDEQYRGEQELLDERDHRLEPLDEAAPTDDPTRQPEPLAADEGGASEREERALEETEPREGQGATIIGTYNSGDNTYVMFSDGSIEAQTPSGVFRFRSLDELKEFIAAGGEGNASASI